MTLVWWQLYKLNKSYIIQGLHSWSTRYFMETASYVSGFKSAFIILLFYNIVGYIFRIQFQVNWHITQVTFLIKFIVQDDHSEHSIALFVNCIIITTEINMTISGFISQHYTFFFLIINDVLIPLKRIEIISHHYFDYTVGHGGLYQVTEWETNLGHLQTRMTWYT